MGLSPLKGDWRKASQPFEKPKVLPIEAVELFNIAGR